MQSKITKTYNNGNMLIELTYTVKHIVHVYNPNTEEMEYSDVIIDNPTQEQIWEAIEKTVKEKNH